jgi:hypothetical protein
MIVGAIVFLIMFLLACGNCDVALDGYIVTKYKGKKKIFS